tara:strand:+ start:679 stop:903 length:225 start_codon:yes stop_codon:yes gene_type:complete
MNIFRINTTANEEEDFFLMTNLNEQDIVEVITPIVNAERDGSETYTNDELLQALHRRYPSDMIVMYYHFDVISI